MERRCETCRFYDRLALCRRSAPVVYLNTVHDPDPVSVWPIVDPDDWCGEWRARDETDGEGE